MSAYFDSEDYNPYKDFAHEASGLAKAARKLWKTKAGKVVIAGLVLIFLGVIVIFLVWGWAIKIQIGLSNLFESSSKQYVQDEATSSIAEKKYYIYHEDEENLSVQYEDSDGNILTVSMDKFLADPYCFHLMLESKELDIFDSDTWQLDDSDVERIFKYILEEEEARKETVTKDYEWPSKLYDYTYHQENHPEWNPETYTYEDHWVTVRSDYPEWQPDDVWEKDYTERAHWKNFTWEFTKLSKRDIHGEKDPIDDLDKFMVRWQLITAISTLVTYENSDNWGNTGDEWVGRDSTEEFVDMDGYYIDDATIQRLVDEFSYKFTFYNDDWNVKNYSFEDMEKTCYLAEYREMEEVHNPGESAYIKKTPAVAPKVISNYYERYIYEYAPTDDGYGQYICTGRTKYTNAIAFAALIKELCPRWDFEDESDYDDFLQLISQFPASERIVERVKELKIIYDWQKETGEQWFPEEVSAECFSLGVRIGRDIDSTLIESPTFLDGEGYIYVPPVEVISIDLGEFCVPTSYERVSSGFGLRVDPVYGGMAGHAGIDLAAGTGTPVVAAFGGKVVGSYFSSDPKGYDKSGFGNYVVLEHSAPGGEKFYTIYAHLSSNYISTGSTVSPGTLIGAVGSTGKSTGAHLHFEVRIGVNTKANAVDPQQIYDFVNKKSRN